MADILTTIVERRTEDMKKLGVTFGIDASVRFIRFLRKKELSSK